MPLDEGYRLFPLGDATGALLGAFQAKLGCHGWSGDRSLEGSFTVVSGCHRWWAGVGLVVAGPEQLDLFVGYHRGQSCDGLSVNVGTGGQKRVPRLR